MIKTIHRENKKTVDDNITVLIAKLRVIFQ